MALLKCCVLLLREIRQRTRKLNSIFPRFQRSSAPQQQLFVYISTQQQRIRRHGNGKQSHLLFNSWSPPPNTRVFVILIQLCVHVEYYTINKRRTLSDLQRKQYLLVCRTHTIRSLLGSNTDMLFCYQIGLWVSEEYETYVGRTHTLSVHQY